VASLYLIVPVAMLFCALAVAAWLWASRSGQFDDLDREARRILQDDPLPRPPVVTNDEPKRDA
jgi:cbb3-type cytochrome oxidase maturation protein